MGCASARSYHEDEEDEEDKGGEVDGPQHRVGLLDLGELKVSQDDAELSKTAQEGEGFNACYLNLFITKVQLFWLATGLKWVIAAKC